MVIEFDLEWAANFNLSQRKNDFLVVDNDPDSDAPTVPRDILLRDPDSDGVSFRATLNNQLVLVNGVSRVTINARGDTTKTEVLSVSGGATKITPQPRSTGLLTGGEIVAGGVPASEFTVETGTGVIWDGTTDPATPTLTDTITWTEFTDETTVGVETFVYITSAGALNLSASKTPALDRSHIYLGLVIDSGTTLTIINAPVTANQIGSYLSDLYIQAGIMINDVVITPNADLTVQNSAGTAFGQSLNWHTDRTTPNEIAIAANDPMPMTYVTQDGDVAASTVTDMDVSNYNPTGGTISAIGGGVRNSTNQRIYITPFGFATLYGQNIFSSLSAAVDQADTENPVIPEWLGNYGILLVTVSVIRTATDLSDDTQAIFNYSAEGGSGFIGKVSTVYRADLDVAILDIDTAGDITILPVTDSTTAFEIQQADTSSVFDIDTINVRVAIGTAAPQTELEIITATGGILIGDSVTYLGNAAPSVELHGAAPGFFFVEVGVTDDNLLFVFDTSDMQFQRRTDAGGLTSIPYRFNITAPANTIRALASGNVGIGTGAPDAPFEVQAISSLGQQAMTIDQNDADQAFIDFQGSSGAGVSFNINTTERNTFQAMVMMELNGTKYWLKAFQ